MVDWRWWLIDGGFLMWWLLNLNFLHPLFILTTPLVYYISGGFPNSPLPFILTPPILDLWPFIFSSKLVNKMSPPYPHRLNHWWCDWHELLFFFNYSGLLPPNWRESLLTIAFNHLLKWFQWNILVWRRQAADSLSIVILFEILVIILVGRRSDMWDYSKRD